ncbi:MAG TPA: hypothetical protein VKG84_05295 [Candidatus Acidoferrales bacterium]|nr:hypothetical protein [Candidatus Acidoferrales bacterium]
MSTSPTPQPHDTNSKALAVNLEASVYGTFAEIGAGQEVARWFLSVGAASGTVAQAISAYDKTVSDDTYGSGTRYVSKERLLAMLDHEYTLLVHRLSKDRGAQTRFFVFADTIATRNYQGTNQQHGWLGLRFQVEPGEQPSQILLHINLRDSHAELQQQAIGILGVNLIYAAYHQRASSAEFLAGLFEGLAHERIDFDVLELSGPAFAAVDSRLWCLDLLARGMSDAIVFDGNAQTVEPSAPLRKRPMIVHRSMYEYPGLFGGDAIQAAQKQFLSEGKAFQREPIVVIQVSIRNPGHADFDCATMLASVKRFAPLGTVVVTEFHEGYRLVDYLRRHTSEPIRMIMGIAGLVGLMQANAYKATPGALLESFGRLLTTDVTLYVGSMPMETFVAALSDMPSGFVVESAASASMTLDDFTPKPPIDHLFRYLRGAGRMVPLE